MGNLWDDPNVPKRDWECVSVIDLCDDGEQGPSDGPHEREYQDCEMCGKERLRYVHTMAHQYYEEQLQVGCICAGKMSDDAEGARAREKKLRNRASRRTNWLKRKWKTSRNENHCLRLKGYVMVVFPVSPTHYRSGGWRFSIRGGICFSISGDSIRIDEFSQRTYGSQDQAKLALFERFCQITENENDED